LCACSREPTPDDPKRKDISIPDDPKKKEIIIPKSLTLEVEQWILQPQKFFQKSGLQLKLLMSESPAWSDVRSYAKQLGEKDDRCLDKFRERFIKIMMMKLDDIGHVPQKGTSATVASSEVNIIQEYVKEGRRLYGLCHDIGKSQSNLDHAELGTLFALPEFATQALYVSFDSTVP
jgi:hypothetical protein